MRTDPSNPIDDPGGKVQVLTAAWRVYDAHPPVDVLQEVADRFDTDLAVRAIHDIGRKGRLRDYAPYFSRFLKLRHQSRQLKMGLA